MCNTIKSYICRCFTYLDLLNVFTKNELKYRRRVASCLENIRSENLYTSIHRKIFCQVVKHVNIYVSIVM